MVELLDRSALPAPRVLFALILTMLAAAPASAQEPAALDGRGPVLLTLPASTRALGLGNAFTIGSTDSDAIFYNTAYADRLRGASAAVQWFGSAGTLYTMSAAVEWWNGALAIGLRALDHELADDARSSERAASAAYARTLFGLRMAVTGQLVEQRIADELNTSAAADLSVGMPVGPVSTGLAIRNIGPSREIAGDDIDMPLLATLSAALSSALPVGPLDVLPAAYVTYEVDGDVVPGAGIEFSYWPLPGRTFSLRIGARNAPAGVQPFTAGAGFTGDRIILDYAVVPYDGGAVSHRFGLRWR